MSRGRALPDDAFRALARGAVEEFGRREVTVEKRAGGKIRCTGLCARLWPPLVVGSARDVPRRIPGSKGTFGVVRRPDGRLQVTYNGLAVYTYMHEGPNEVRCNNVEGWFVVRL